MAADHIPHHELAPKAGGSDYIPHHELAPGGSDYIPHHELAPEAGGRPEGMGGQGREA
jgi:hypothetical protein